MKTTQYAVIDNKGNLTGFGTMIEAIQFAEKMANHSCSNQQIVKITREHCKTIEPAVEEQDLSTWETYCDCQ